MIALLLAGVCALPPLFDMSGPDCVSSRQTLECECSECMAWDPSPGAEWYEIGRQDPGGVSAIYVGDTIWRNKPPIGEEGSVTPASVPPLWCFAWDLGGVPAEGELYLYRVRACVKGACSEYTGRSVDYMAAPYWVVGE